MAYNKKLSIYLNGCSSYHDIKDAKSDYVLDIAFDFIKNAEDRIYKQPTIALRAIKVEMLDIHIHYDRFVNELEGYIKELNTIVSRGPRLDEIDLGKVKILEEKRNVLSEFVYLLEDSIGYMTRMLLEHYSELENDRSFLDKFSRYLGRFDWMSKRSERFRNEFIMKNVYDSKTASFEREVIMQAKKLIADNEIITALSLLLSYAQEKSVEKEVIILSNNG